MPERRVASVPKLPHPERRKHPEPTMIDVLTFINRQISDIRTELTARRKEEAEEFATAVASLMKEAFPEGDPAGHKRHHEAVIRQAEARAAFWQDMAKSTARWGILGFIGFLVYAAWTAFLRGPQ